MKKLAESEKLQIYQNNRPTSVTLQEIRLKPPNRCILHVAGDIHNFRIGDRINVASRKFIVSGIVMWRNDLNNSLISSTEVVFLIK